MWKDERRGRISELHRDDPRNLLIESLLKLFHLGEHYRRVGGDNKVIEACQILRTRLKSFGEPIRVLQEAKKTNGT